MTIANSLYVKRAETSAPESSEAVASIASQLHSQDAAGVVFFCSSKYDPDLLGRQLTERFECPVVGCTTAGEIGSSYQSDGIVAMSFSSEAFRFHPYLIESMAGFQAQQAREMADSLEKKLEFSESLSPEGMFGLLLLDGLSILEEPVTAYVDAAMQGISVVGGSAGDSLQFQEARVFSGGRFTSGAGVFVLVETRLAFRTFKHQHFVPSDKDLVITEADPSTRTVSEIDGGNAAEEYARALGLEAAQLTPEVFAKYPVMLEIGDQWYVRSIHSVNTDGSLEFFAAIDEGLPLTIAKGAGFVECLKSLADDLMQDFGSIEGTIGFDCVLRRLELEEAGLTGLAQEALRPLKLTGFSTFGEQFGAVHINQTLTGVVLGGELRRG